MNNEIPEQVIEAIDVIRYIFDGSDIEKQCIVMYHLGKLKVSLGLKRKFNALYTLIDMLSNGYPPLFCKTHGHYVEADDNGTKVKIFFEQGASTPLTVTRVEEEVK